jgi:hypothetical protein
MTALFRQPPPNETSGSAATAKAAHPSINKSCSHDVASPSSLRANTQPMFSNSRNSNACLTNDL